MLMYQSDSSLEPEAENSEKLEIMADRSKKQHYVYIIHIL